MVVGEEIVWCSVAALVWTALMRPESETTQVSWENSLAKCG
jgi:hypothetical protein